MWHIARPRLWRERKEISVSGACGLPLMAGQYAQVHIKRGLYCLRLPAVRCPAHCPSRVQLDVLTVSQTLPDSGPLWAQCLPPVIRVILIMRRSLPVYLDEQTFSESVTMSQTYQ